MTPDPPSFRRCHVGVVTARDAGDRRVWSGTPYFMTRALRRHAAQVSTFAPVESDVIRALNRVVGVQRPFTGWTSSPGYSAAALRRNARRIKDQQTRIQADVLFAPAGSALIPGLRIDTPVAYSSDGTAQLLNGYYGAPCDPSSTAFRHRDMAERRAIARADMLIYPTGWAARSAIDDYGADPAKVHVVPYGANLDTPPDRDRALAPRQGGGVNLLFIGVDWTRKGGDIAVATVQALHARGIPARLTIVGCVPPKGVTLDGVRVIPFLDKSDPEQARQLARLYYAADLFILPTLAECYGIVLAEAAAHGVPCLCTDTGGVSGAMTPGRSGFLMRPEDGARAYADRIATLLAEPGRLGALRRTARAEFERCFNWDIWARRTVDIFARHLERSVARVG